MSMVVTHNISAINTQRNLLITNRHLSKSLEKLSSGYRINVGADAPADLVISEQLRAQTVGLERAIRNTNEAMNVLAIAEGALNEMNEILKRMRQLALHASNSGITSPEQVSADQAEVDSSIQTIDRIANTTKYSDQFLLNGSKGIVYDRQTLIKGTQNNALLDLSASRVDQIFKREGFDIAMSFSGTSGPDDDTAIGKADLTKAATKAYFEIDSANADIDVDSTSHALTKAQSFILTGTKGARLFNFDVGASMGQIATAISNVSDSTGVDASLIFASNQTITAGSAVSAAGGVIGTGGTSRGAGDMVISNNFTSIDAADTEAVITAATAATNVVAGQATDGQGRIWVKITGDDSYELYKDRSLSAESLVGHGSSGATMVMDNNSGLYGLTLTIATDNAGRVATLNLFGLEGTQTLSTTTTISSVNYSGGFVSGGTTNQFDSDLAFFSGVELGKNTDSEGRLYFKVKVDEGTAATTGQIFAYKDSRMADEDLVAVSRSGVQVDAGTVILDEVKNSEGTNGTGLAIALDVGGGFSGVDSDNAEYFGQVQFTNVGVRISSSEYGANEYVRVQQDAGTVWQYYGQADSDTPTLVDASKGGVTVQQNGQDATLSINGQRVKTDGLKLDLSTQDITAQLVFNEGSIGSTTIAQVGYDVGSIFSQATLLTSTLAGFDDGGGNVDQVYDPDDADDGSGTGVKIIATGVVGNDDNTVANDIKHIGALLCNPGHTTLESMKHFQNGMQFQLGEGAGDQERTVYGIQSMAVSNLGRVQFQGVFDDSTSVVEKRTLSLQDMLGGGFASLGNDPVKALAIIDRAIEDVSTLRARLGATQMNLLQTNANNLRVSMENIIKTESFIRDANMAEETTEFTKNQILVSAGTSMLAQANVQAQNVLQLLG